MTFSISQLHFAAEFTVFLVSLAGLALAVRGRALSGRPTVRSLFAAGFLAEAAAAFLYGSLLITHFDDPSLTVLRLVGLVLLVGGAVGWSVSSWPRAVFLVGLVGLLAGEAGSVGVSDQWAAVVRVGGAVLVGVALVLAARHSIPARIGTSAAALLLVVILAVSIALSVVINRNVTNSAFARLDSRAASYATGVAGRIGSDLGLRSKVLGVDLAQNYQGLLAQVVSGDPAQRDRAKTQLATVLDDYGHADWGLFEPRTQSVLFVVGDNKPILVAGARLSPTELLGLAGAQTTSTALGARSARTQATQGVALAGRQIFSLAAYRVPIRPAGGGPAQFGAVVVASELDRGVLQQVVQGDTDTSIMLIAPGLDTATASYRPSQGVKAPTEVLRRAGRALFSGRSFPHTTADGAFVVARVLRNGDNTPITTTDSVPVAAVVVTSPTASVDHTREELFRTLFVVALGGTLLAMVLATTVGERLGSGLGRLSTAAARIRGGDLRARTGLTSPDELGALSSSFDAMAGSLATMTDDLRQAARDEAQLRGRLEAVVAGMGDALLAVDRDGRVTDFNRAAEELFGVDESVAVGRRIDEVVTMVEGEGLATPTRDAAERVVRGAGGEPVPVSVSVGPLRGGDGELGGAVVVVRDMRREHEVDEMKTQFLANISHELRTPLTPIKGYAGVLAHREVTHEQATQFAGEISAGVDQLERIIGQLVDFASMAAGRLRLQVEPVPVRALVDDLVARRRARLPEGYVLTRRVARDARPVLVDLGYLGQCLDELIDNAVKYSPGGGRISIRGEPGQEAAEDGPTTRLVVTDQGIGLEPEDFDRLLADFAQADGSSTRRFGGLGLGLTMVDRVVRAHRGSFTCESGAVRGTRFVIELPAVDARDPQEPAGEVRSDRPRRAAPGR